MKINDYVKYENEIVKIIDIVESRQMDAYILSNGITTIDLCLYPATPEETLEMFEGRFEELGYELNFSQFDVYLKKDGAIKCHIYKTNIDISKTYDLPNSLIDLIREFQNWYWRDK